MLYNLSSYESNANAIIDLVSNADRFHAFFQAGGNDDRFLQFAPIKFKAQQGYTQDSIGKADYLEASIGVPVVSVTFVEALGPQIQQNIAFYACEISCAGALFPFYVGRISTYAHLVNVDTSDFRQLTDGREVIKNPKYKTVAEKDFYIARDTDFPHLMAASEALVSLNNRKQSKYRLQAATILIMKAA